MKLFRQLLVAPAALGLLAPITATATEINLKSISNYAPVTNAFQANTELSDIHPTDWTFQALTEVRNSRGCNATLPTGIITRAEAAALLNKCIGDASSLSDKELRLIDEFGPELATLKGTKEVLDTFAFEAGAFSSTTVLSGSANMNFGAVVDSTDEEFKGNYELGYTLSTSFSGEDELVAAFELGNASTTGLGIDPESSNGSSPVLDDFYYSFPLNGFNVCVGALMDGDACLAGTYTTYSESVYNGAYDYWSEGVGNGTALAVSKVFDNGFNVSGNIQGGNTGVLASGSDNYTAQIGYDGENYGGAITYTSFDGDDSAYGVGIYYSPDGFPSFTVGADIKDQSTATYTELTSFFIGAEAEVGEGTLGGSYQSKESGTTTATAQASYEVFYAYPATDNITLTPSFWIVEDGNGTKDTTGYALTVGFSF